jgi:hypothetical protein
MNLGPRPVSFLSFLSKVSERAGFEKDTRGGESVFMSKALRGKDKKTFGNEQVSFSNTLA